MLYKVRDWQAGETLTEVSISENKKKELEKLVLEHLLNGMPKSVGVVRINIDVALSFTGKPGDGIPFDGTMFQYNLDIKIKEPSKQEMEIIDETAKEKSKKEGGK